MTRDKNHSPIQIRSADPSDAPALAGLLAELEYPVEVDELSKRLNAMQQKSEILLVATVDEEVRGLLTMHFTPVVHRPVPVARVTLLAVYETSQGLGVGRALLDTAEQVASTEGCSIVEIISNKRYRTAHKFYEHLGYELTSYKFKKILDAD